MEFLVQTMKSLKTTQPPCNGDVRAPVLCAFVRWSLAERSGESPSAQCTTQPSEQLVRKPQQESDTSESECFIKSLPFVSVHEENQTKSILFGSYSLTEGKNKLSSVVSIHYLMEYQIGK